MSSNPNENRSSSRLGQTESSNPGIATAGGNNPTSTSTSAVTDYLAQSGLSAMGLVTDADIRQKYERVRTCRNSLIDLESQIWSLLEPPISSSELGTATYTATESTEPQLVNASESKLEYEYSYCTQTSRGRARAVKAFKKSLNSVGNNLITLLRGLGDSTLNGRDVSRAAQDVQVDCGLFDADFAMSSTGAGRLDGHGVKTEEGIEEGNSTSAVENENENENDADVGPGTLDRPAVSVASLMRYEREHAHSTNLQESIGPVGLRLSYDPSLSSRLDVTIEEMRGSCLGLSSAMSGFAVQEIQSFVAALQGDH